MLVCFHRQQVSRSTIKQLFLLTKVEENKIQSVIGRYCSRGHGIKLRLLYYRKTDKVTFIPPSWSASRDLLALRMWLQNILMSVAFIGLYCSVEGFWLWNKPTKRPTSANDIKTPLIIGKQFEFFLLQSCHRIRNRSRKIPDRDYQGF